MTVDVEKIVKWSTWLFYMIIPVIFIFLWNSYFSLNAEIDSGKLGTFGDFIGGVFGSIWSLCGVLIFYSALKEQREDFKTNKSALAKQTEALQMQMEEFKLQRDELSQSRQVFIEQSKTLKQQRMAAIYFSLLDLYRKIVSGLNEQSSSGNYFKEFKEKFFANYTAQSDYGACRQHADEVYSELYYQSKEDLSQYFKIVYRILKVIDKSDLDEAEKFEFVTIFRSQLGENEMFALYYNAHSGHGALFYSYILRFNLLKHLPALSKVEFSPYVSQASSLAKLLSISNDVWLLMSRCLEILSHSINFDDFDQVRQSSLLGVDDQVLLVATTGEFNEITLEFSGDKVIEKMSKWMPVDGGFEKYIGFYLNDAFGCSRFISRELFSAVVTVSKSESLFAVSLRAEKKLSLNADADVGA